MMDLARKALDVFVHLDRHLNALGADLGGWLYGLLFLIVFCETGLVVTPFLPVGRSSSESCAGDLLCCAFGLQVWIVCQNPYRLLHRALHFVNLARDFILATRLHDGLLSRLIRTGERATTCANESNPSLRRRLETTPER
jgi:hypothetical protein